MLSILDKYILKKFFSTFIFIFFLMLLITVVIDYSEKSDDFVKSKQSFMYIINNYHAGFIPHIMAMLFHLFVFIAAIYFTSQMAQRAEIIAILAAGVSYNRFLRPYLIGSFILGGLLWWASLSFIPKSNKLYSDFKTKYLDANSKVEARGKQTNTFFIKLDSSTYAGIENFDSSSKMSYKFFTAKVKNGRVVENLRSGMFKWDTTQKLNKWRVENAVLRQIDAIGERDSVYPSKTMNYAIKPADLMVDLYVKDKLSNTELKRRIVMEKIKGTNQVSTLQVELYRRGATAFAIVILTLIAVFIASRKVRGGMGLNLAMGLIIGVSYVLMDKFSTVFATKANFNPLLAAWMPNIVYALLCIYLYRRAQK
jgi:lipopolysaccharide export system permease protein